jgi:cell division transport system ATP-binding protein
MILLDNVSKYYPGDKLPALDNISLHIQPKEFVFLVGKSGAGKSTLIKMLTREEKPTSGKIMVGGIDYDYMKRRHVPHLRRRLGVVFQDFKLLPNRTVYENVAFALEIVGVSNAEIRRTVPKVLELVGLADKGHKFPAELSGGERERVAIARSMARQPKILIADEPTGNLDPETSWGIVSLLEEINNFGTTILVTTHDEKIVNQLKKRVITIRDGKVIGDQKNDGHYDLDASHTKIVKRPLATTIRTAPTAEQIRRATTSQPEVKPVQKSAPVATPQPKRVHKRRFIN